MSERREFHKTMPVVLGIVAMASELTSTVYFSAPGTASQRTVTARWVFAAMWSPLGALSCGGSAVGLGVGSVLGIALAVGSGVA
ncbi:MAG: hypothetical protein Q3997_00290, partial [Propionibacteriaceae bacterium]|nr:hypothetical protein [Propionibacteriaceae bacterium]